MVNVLTQNTHTHKRIQERFGRDMYVYYLDNDDGITVVCICPNSSRYTH